MDVNVDTIKRKHVRLKKKIFCEYDFQRYYDIEH
jgi:hypothetical protein